MTADLVRTAEVGIDARRVEIDSDGALTIAEKWVGYAWEHGLRYEEFDIDDDHVVVVVYNKSGQVNVWLWVEYEPIPCTKR